MKMIIMAAMLLISGASVAFAAPSCNGDFKSTGVASAGFCAIAK